MSQITELIAVISKTVCEMNLNSGHHAFFENHGHVQEIGVRVYFDGWKYDREPNLSFNTYYSINSYRSEADVVDALKSVMGELNNINQ